MRRLLLAIAAVVVVAAVGFANAASTGPVTPAGVEGFVGSGASGAPTVYASDHFTASPGGNLSGRQLAIGQVWVVPTGTWLLTGTTTEINGVPLARAVTATGQANVRIVATVHDSGQGGRTSGLVFRSDAAGSTFLSTFTQSGSGGRIYLAKRNITSTTLVTASGVPFTNPATFVVELNGANVKVSYNGVQYINHTLSILDQPVFNGLTSHGLLNDNAATVRYDDFRVESLV